MDEYTNNLLGAASLAIVDQIEAAAYDVLGMGGQAPGALVLLGLRPGMAIGKLADRLRLSQPGAVRLVERLVEAGWVHKEPAEDRRAVRLTLTKDGLKQLRMLRERRLGRLHDLTAGLTASERDALRPILVKLIERATPDVVSAFANCRLCETELCRSQGCPIDALAEKAGPRAG